MLQLQGPHNSMGDTCSRRIALKERLNAILIINHLHVINPVFSRQFIGLLNTAFIIFNTKPHHFKCNIHQF